MIISVLNQKGGVGKTTLSSNIAAQLASEGHRILLIDADPQGSSLDWSAAREADSLVTVVGLPRATLHKEIGKFSNDYDHIIIDGPPRGKCNKQSDFYYLSSTENGGSPFIFPLALTVQCRSYLQQRVQPLSRPAHMLLTLTASVNQTFYC